MTGKMLIVGLTSSALTLGAVLGLFGVVGYLIWKNW